MYREEILDMAMDILDNTDATLEEAMGIAIESAENKMSDVEKYKRRMIKAKMSSGDNSERRFESLKNTPEYRRSNGKSSGYRGVSKHNSQDARRATLYHQGIYDAERMDYNRNHADELDRERRRMMDADYRRHKSEDKIRNNTRRYGHPYQTRKGAKESAIMDTALDFLDMYDVSLEEAIDMAYDYIG